MGAPRLSGIVAYATFCFMFSILGVGALFIAIRCFLLIVFCVLMTYIITNAYRLILYEYMNEKKLPNGIDENLVKASLRTDH